jgi:predicted transcriptional regulator
MRKKVPIAVKLDADLLDRLDKYQSKLSPPVTRTAIIETAVQEWLDRREGKKPRP